jgi:membrane-bound lytic murein transglycosylase MltF
MVQGFFMRRTWQIVGTAIWMGYLGVTVLFHDNPSTTADRDVDQAPLAATPQPTHPTVLLAKQRRSSAHKPAESLAHPTGDLDVAKRRGKLRVLTLYRHEVLQPGESADPQKTLIRAFAEEHGMEAIWIQLSDAGNLERALNDGLGDVIIDQPLGKYATDSLRASVALFHKIDNGPVAWYTRSENPALRDALNGFINQHGLGQMPRQIFVGDLDYLKNRGVLRVVARPEPGNWTLSSTGPAGFEYDLIKEFARRQDLTIELLVSHDEQQMLHWLAQGRADLVAAQLDGSLVASAAVDSSHVYRSVEPVVIASCHANPIDDLADLYGRPLVLHRETDNWSYLTGLVRSGLPLYLQAAPESMTVDQLLEAVAAGGTAYTVVDRNLDHYLVNGRRGIEKGYPLGRLEKRWLVRSGSPQLLGELNNFIDSLHGGRFYAVTYRKHFSERALNPDQVAYHPLIGHQLSPFDDLVRSSADRYGFDWRLIVAQIYQESRFNPDARSSKGARGLMQMLPKTARELGIGDLDDPEAAIEAGVSYLSKLRDRFEPELTVEARTWFALAAYNAGYARIQRARSQAAREGRDPNRWFGHVEHTVKTRQTVKYVRNVRHLFDTYRHLLPQDTMAAILEASPELSQVDTGS